jgi:hypothetical protein
VAYAPTGVTFQRLYRREFIPHLTELIFNLKDGVATDYQANNLGWHMCSGQLKQIIDLLCIHEEKIQWLPVSLNVQGKLARYYLLHAFSAHDVLSKHFTIYSDDHLVKPVINASAAGNLNFFAVPGDSVRLYASHIAKRKIQMAGVSGLKFLKVATVGFDPKVVS